MKNFLHKKIWRTGKVQIHLESPLITLIKIKNDAKSDRDSVKLNCVGILRQKIGSLWFWNGLVLQRQSRVVLDVCTELLNEPRGFSNALH